MSKRNISIKAMAIAAAMAWPVFVQAQQQVGRINPEGPAVSYSGVKATPIVQRESTELTRMVKTRGQQTAWQGLRIPQATQQKNVLGNLLRKHPWQPRTIGSKQLREARRAVNAPFNRTQLIVNVIYNSIDEEKEEGLFALDVQTGELTCLASGYEHAGFNGGGYIWNGKYRGVFFEPGTVVNKSNLATIYEYDLNDFSQCDTMQIRYMSSMMGETATLIRDDGTTKVYGQAWHYNGQGLHYATLDDDGIFTTGFGESHKQMLAMGVTKEEKLYGVAKDGNLYLIEATADSNVATETLIGHTGVGDLIDTEGSYYLQGGEIDQRTNTFYWMADHNQEEKTELYSVDLETGKAELLIDFEGDVECAGMVIAPQLKQSSTPDMAEDLSVSFNRLATDGTLTFKAPVSSFDGTPLPDDASLYYRVFMWNDNYPDGVELELTEHTARPGEEVSLGFDGGDKVRMNAENFFDVTVALGAEGEQSLAATTSAWSGYGKPQPPQNVKAVREGDLITISWDAPPTGDHAGAKGGVVEVGNYPDMLFYTVALYADGKLLNVVMPHQPVTQAVFAITDALKEGYLADYTFGVQVEYRGLSSDEVRSDGFVIGVGKEVPFGDDFANSYAQVDQSLYTIIDGNGDGKTWIFIPPHTDALGRELSGAVACPTNDVNDMDDWFITPGMVLKAGTTYKFRSNVHGPSGNWMQYLAVKAGTDRTAEAMTQTIVDRTRLTNGEQKLEAEFTVAEDGIYFFGFHDTSDKLQWETAIFDYEVVDAVAELGDLQAPAAGTVTANALYGISDNPYGLPTGTAKVNITLPTKNRDGSDITANMMVVLILKNQQSARPVMQWPNQAPGAELSYDVTAATGEYTFLVQVTNYSDGANHTGEEFSTSAYIGWDNEVGTPSGAKTIQTEDGKLYVTWDDPGTELRGAHGCYLPKIEYLGYSGSKAAYLERAIASTGSTAVIANVPADAVSEDGKRLEVPNVIPNEGMAYYGNFYVVCKSVAPDGTDIYSNIKQVKYMAGAPVAAPAVETGSQTFIVDADLSDELFATYNYYLNRGAQVAGIWPAEDFQTGIGHSWEVFSFFNGRLSGEFSKVSMPGMQKPVLSLDVKLDDPEVRLQVVLRGPEGFEAMAREIRSQSGVQHIAIPLDDYKHLSWIQPSVVTIFEMNEEGITEHGTAYDNILVYDELENNLAVLDVEAPATMLSGEEGVVNAYVMNLGERQADGYTLQLKDGDVVLESKAFDTSLKPKEMRVAQFRYRANTVVNGSRFGEDIVEKELTVAVEADGDLLEADNAVSTLVMITVEGGEKNTYPTNATAKQVDSDIEIAWQFDGQNAIQPKTESFEQMELWSTGGVVSGGKEGQLSAWRLYDGDNKPTYTWENFESVTTSAGKPQAWQVFSGDVFGNSGSWDIYMTANTGSQYLVSMDPADGDFIPRADDYLISPLVKGGSEVSFYYAQLIAGRTQTFEVLYSTETQQVADFKPLPEPKVIVANSVYWDVAAIDLPQDAKYFAIHHKEGSYCGYGMKLDDVSYVTYGKADHFNVYIDGVLAGQTKDAATLSFTTPLTLADGSHQAAITVVYEDGTESIPTYVKFQTRQTSVDGIEQVVSGTEPFDVYSVDGKLVRRQTRSAEGLKGIFVVGGKSVMLK